MTDEYKELLRKSLMDKSINELVDMVIKQQEEVLEARAFRKTIMQVRNLVTPPAERRPQGRPKKDSF